MNRPIICAILITLTTSCLAAAPKPDIMLMPRGLVEIRSGTSDAWFPVNSPTALSPGHQVRTKEASGADILFSDGSKVELSPMAEFSVEKVDRHESSFKLGLGKLKAYVNGILSSRMKIHTPTAVCSVRGTEFELQTAEGSTDMNVVEGHLEVQDSKGNNAVVTSEETLRVGANGMETPRLMSLKDDRAQEAARPAAVRMEMARDSTRAMLEDLRSRELKTNEAQLGKDVIDAFGRRVRLEEYILRPANNQFKLLFLSKREHRMDWGHLTETFHAKIPDDLTQVPAIVAATYFSRTMPSNWLTSQEIYLTNKKDAIREVITLGNPTAVDFSGFNANLGTLYYPSTRDHVQTVYGPGIPGGSKLMFQQTWEYTTNRFTVVQKMNDVTDTGLKTYTHFYFNPGNTLEVADLQAGGCGGGCYYDDRVGDPTIDPTTTTSFPSGSTKADFKTSTQYANGDTLSTEKILVNNDGKIFDFANPNADTFTQEGNYNMEIVVKSSLFQGRDIDVLIAPEIFKQTKQSKATQLTPQ